MVTPLKCFPFLMALGVPGFHSQKSSQAKEFGLPAATALAWKLGDLTFNPDSVTYLQIKAWHLLYFLLLLQPLSSMRNIDLKEML